MFSKFALIISFIFISTPSFSKDTASPYDLISDSVFKVMEYMKSAPKETKAKKEYTYKVINEAVLPLLDFLSMTKIAVGKHWRKSNEIQQKKLHEEFEKLLTKTYLKVFTEYEGLEVKVLPFKASSRPDRAVVETEVKYKKSSDYTSIIYKLRLTKEKKWLIYDIKVEGISLVTNYRSSFDAKILQRGIDGLIRVLEDKNRQDS